MNNDTISRMAEERRVNCPYAGSGNVCWRMGSCDCGTQSKWISVKERLPSELTEVLAYTDLGEQRVSMAFLEGGKWLDGYSGRGIELMQQELVTHWLDLPEPPEEDNNA